MDPWNLIQVMLAKGIPGVGAGARLRASPGSDAEQSALPTEGAHAPAWSGNGSRVYDNAQFSARA